MRGGKLGGFDFERAAELGELPGRDGPGLEEESNAGGNGCRSWRGDNGAASAPTMDGEQPHVGENGESFTQGGPAYRELTGQVVGFKAAGGIRTPAQALEWMRLVEEELGAEALSAARFRLGASGLLDAIVRRLEELAGLGGARSAAPGVSRRVEEAEY